MKRISKIEELQEALSEEELHPPEATLRDLLRLKCVLQSSAIPSQPHQPAYYLRSLATHFHRYYNACKFIVDDKSLTLARLSLINATQQILKNGLSILGVGAPESM